MPLRILIIPDKFKGTLSAGAAARAIAKGWHEARRQDSLDLLPMTDGGDGFGEVISGLLRARVQRLETVDAAHRPCSARWWWEPRTKTAIIESAAIVGRARCGGRPVAATLFASVAGGGGRAKPVAGSTGRHAGLRAAKRPALAGFCVRRTLSWPAGEGG